MTPQTDGKYAFKINSALMEHRILCIACGRHLGFHDSVFLRHPSYHLSLSSLSLGVSKYICNYILIEILGSARYFSFLFSVLFIFYFLF